MIILSIHGHCVFLIQLSFWRLSKIAKVIQNEKGLKIASIQIDREGEIQIGVFMMKMEYIILSLHRVLNYKMEWWREIICLLKS